MAELIGESAAIVGVRAQVNRLLQQAGRRPLPILLQGETGTGKGLVAHAIHVAGPRAAGPFTDVNCAAIPDTLLESEMSGYERGAFAGAGQGKPGLFQVANRGTIFLEEIGLLPAPLQSKLLKVVEERQVRRLGATRSEAIDVAIVAATSEDLDAAVRAGRFRADLYHRLAVVTIRLPPLRERGADVLSLGRAGGWRPITGLMSSTLYLGWSNGVHGCLLSTGSGGLSSRPWSVMGLFRLFGGLRVCRREGRRRSGEPDEHRETAELRFHGPVLLLVFAAASVFRPPCATRRSAPDDYESWGNPGITRGILGEYSGDRRTAAPAQAEPARHVRVSGADGDRGRGGGAPVD